MNLVGKTVLISQAHLAEWAGSEVVTAELAEFFLNQGAKVVICTFAQGAVANEIRELSERLWILDYDSEELEDLLQKSPPVLAWIHHSVIPRYILERVSSIPIVFNHMSASVPIEYSLNYLLELKMSTLSVYNAPKILDSHLATRCLDGYEPNRFQIFQNPAPAAYSINTHAGKSIEPRILVVTNHAPEELVAALDELALTAEITRIGTESQSNFVSQRVTPELIAQHDVVISIGKTVQYALAAGTPVYCYDYFGGPGWITPENAEEASYDNFSGRGFAKKTVGQLVDEIGSGIVSSETFSRATALREDWGLRISLPLRMSTLLEFVEKYPRAISPLEAEVIETNLIAQSITATYVREWVRKRHDLGIATAMISELTRSLETERSKLRKIKRLPMIRMLLWFRKFFSGTNPVNSKE